MTILKKHDGNTFIKKSFSPQKKSVQTFAPINIALIKYWGKRDEELMLPYNDNLSITLKNLGTHTTLSFSNQNNLIINGERVDEASEKYQRVFKFFHDICGNEFLFTIDTHNNIPIASGLASSASAFASFALAINELFSLHLMPTDIANLARLGSVSAARSLMDGFVLMHKEDGGIENLETDFQDFCIGFCLVSKDEKNYKSRDNMRYTVSSSIFYESWLQLASRDLQEILPVLKRGDFCSVGEIAERNALCMHASIALLKEADRFYLKSESLQIIKKAQSLRKKGLFVFCTVDAGPNVKLLFQSEDLPKVKEAFPEMNFFEKVL